MDKRQFRNAFVKARRVLVFGMAYQEEDFTPLQKLAGEFFYKMSRATDPLQARLGGFTPSARTRITLYPLRSSRG
ncbi:hypothetical protein [Pseudomonas syringae]|uniref:hypothetical protein n=1 Tax=Pseudomonas syringae TaxID=317 RepID=UPI001F1B3EBB|nr:hypothetical protein [Pseudomonas syringae]MCF5371961.1 hypothetical protein [Pseudomonas syringae]MCF5382042.1 hypothetical protein [Pseudomonas syringae]MCF5419424.1 hypothetical protein [Pseudomonas syringae]MCF5451971.1 hypothetical protein [Pseudomonas syringae]MCF5458755.1 hypothetical protein [Pseudomonas syringae]